MYHQHNQNIDSQNIQLCKHQSEQFINNHQDEKCQQQHTGMIENDQLKLWKEVTKRGSSYDHLTQSKDFKVQRDQSIPQQEKEKNKLARISTFLKEIQISTKYESQHRFGSQSQILSILDIQYSQQTSRSKSFKILENSLTSKHNPNFITDILSEEQRITQQDQISREFQILKQSYEKMKQQMANILSKTSNEINFISVYITQMIKNHENEIKDKNIRIRQLELNIKQIQLNNKQKLHALQIELKNERQIQISINNEKQKNAQKLNELSQKIKTMKITIQTQRTYNKQLNQKLKWYFNNITNQQQKIKNIQKLNQQKLYTEIQKIKSKYQENIKQKQINFQLKLENHMIRMINIMKDKNMRNSFVNSCQENVIKSIMTQYSLKSIYLSGTSQGLSDKELVPKQRHSQNQKQRNQNNSQICIETDIKSSHKMTLSNTDSSCSSKLNCQRKFSRTNRANQNNGSSFILKKDKNDKNKQNIDTNLCSSVSSILFRNKCPVNDTNFKIKDQNDLFNKKLGLTKLGKSTQCLQNIFNIKNNKNINDTIKPRRNIRQTII